VQNVLSAIGAAPHLTRPNLPAPAHHYPAGVILTLVPFGERALQHFMFLERPEGTALEGAEGIDAPVHEAVALMAEGDIVPQLQDFATVGHLYRSIEHGLARLADKFGERNLFVGPPRAQATSTDFQWPELVAVTDLASAQRALDTILEQGEGARGHWETARFGQFLEIIEEYEQGYATAQWITRNGASKGLDASRMAVAGESVGGNMTAALALMAKERGDVTFVQQSMYYPVTDAAMNTASYDQFATDYYLSRKAMRWFWDAYTIDPAQRAEITASPNQASTEQVAGLPPTYLCVDEADVLRDEGEAYAAKLRSAGVPVTTVRYDGTIHDFMLLNALSETRATRAAIDQATAFLRAGLGTG
jgi:dienelactone hydrolase